MSRKLQHLVEALRPCSYLPDERASLEHRVLLDVTGSEFDGMLSRGWRRFGPDYFRPLCPLCVSCVSTRIVTRDFVPTKSQRRARRNALRFRITLGPPKVDEQRLALYHAWHADREAVRAWSPSHLDPRDYFLQFAFPHPAARELLFIDEAAGGRIVGIGICDETPRALSLVYFFYDPEYASLSLGVANVVVSVEIAMQRGYEHVYLGYCVADCPSLQYKSSFNAREILDGRPSDTETPRWVRVE